MTDDHDTGKKNESRHERPTRKEQDRIQSRQSVLSRTADRILAIADQLIPERALYGYQKVFGHAIIMAILSGSSEEITALFARQAGKTETIARVSVALAILLPNLWQENPGLFPDYHGGLWIGIFAPIKDQASTSFERMAEVLNAPRTQAIMTRLGLRVTESNKGSRVLNQGSFIRIWSASPLSNIESKTLHLAIVEEAQDVSATKIRKSIEPMLTATAGTLVLVGTANGIKSLFWESIENNRKRLYENPENTFHFEFNWRTVIEHNPHYRAFLNKKLSDRGKGWIESDAFKMAYDCKFVLERGQLLSIPRLLEMEALGRTLPRGPYDAHGVCVLQTPIVAGIDWGKSGDSTVVTLIARYGDVCRIVDWLELLGDNYDAQFQSIVTFLQRFPTLTLVLAETNGVGDPMTDRLKQAARLQHIPASVAGFFASEANNSDGYKNLLIDFIHANRLLLPADEASRASREYQNFIGQLTDAVKEWRGSLLKVHAGEAGNGTFGPRTRHDDYVSSLMMAYWAASRMTTQDLFRQFYQ